MSKPKMNYFEVMSKLRGSELASCVKLNLSKEVYFRYDCGNDIPIGLNVHLAKFGLTLTNHVILHGSITGDLEWSKKLNNNGEL